MKPTFKMIALFVLGLALQTSVLAQKMGYVELDSIIKGMPESKKAEAILAEHGKALEKEIISMQQELQKKIEDYQKIGNAPDIVKRKLEEEIRDLQQRIESFRQQAEQDYQQKTMEVSRPIYDKAKKAVEAVAKENGYKYILDASQGMILYKEASDDIAALVTKKLSTMPEAVLPGAPATNSGTNTPAKGTGTSAPKTPATPTKKPGQ